MIDSKCHRLDSKWFSVHIFFLFHVFILISGIKYAKENVSGNPRYAPNFFLVNFDVIQTLNLRLIVQPRVEISISYRPPEKSLNWILNFYFCKNSIGGTFNIFSRKYSWEASAKNWKIIDSYFPDPHPGIHFCLPEFCGLKLEVKWIFRHSLVWNNLFYTFKNILFHDHC